MNARLKFLYQQFIDETCTAEEREEFFSLISEEDQDINDLLDGTWNTIEVADDLSKEKAEVMLNQILTKPENQVVKKLSWYKYASVAAAVLILLSAGLYFFNNRSVLKQQKDTYSKSISPAGNKATLTLSNGSTINLDNATTGEIAKQSGIAITKTAEGKLIYQLSATNKPVTGFNSISTPRGGHYQVDLPDGTRVWLNAASSLKYPAAFDNHERKVELSGEAYFEVAKRTVKDGLKSKRVPFIVKTSSQEVAVLGTHFNISAYGDDKETKTTLLEGSVRVSLAKDPGLKQGRFANTGSQILSPGQQSLLKDNQIITKTVDLDEAIAWKNGFFQFNEENIVNIMKQLSRWYDIDVVFEGKQRETLFLLKVPRSLSLTEILKILETNGINFKIEGRTLIVKS
ncbi:FecR family protein [Pedobacter gandavensis]|uniref:FecR family protein n=1 Tax=Pedobacter gandavensis TaxID=2679963 RepID=UPI002931BE04|nr:FecR family protein [Pedobacter gandavensis]